MLALSLLTLALSAAEPESYALDNGMHVILDRQSGAASVHVCLEYNAGSVDDPPDAIGLNALAFHLALRPLANLGDRAPSDVLARHGALVSPASQIDSSTRFCSTLAPNELEAALWVESHRAMFLSEPIADDQLARAKAQVVAGMSLGVSGDVFPIKGRDTVELWNRLFADGSPYRIEKRQGAALTEERLQTLAPLYSASNAVLVLVGDLPGNVRKLVAKHFAGAPTYPKRDAIADVPPSQVAVAGVNRLLGVWLFTPSSPREREIGDVVARLLTADMREIDFAAESQDLRRFTVFTVLVRDFTGKRSTEQNTASLAERLREVRDSVQEERLQVALRQLALEREMKEQSYGRRAHAHTYFFAWYGAPLSPRAAAQRYVVTVDDVRQFIATRLAVVPAVLEQGGMVAAQ